MPVSVPEGQPKPELNRQLIIDVATTLAERDGVDSLSMRRVADVFGVTAMALYKHVEGKQQLLDLMADRYLEQLDLAEGERDWRQRLARIFRSFHHLMQQHPVIGDVMARQPLDGEAAHRMGDIVIGALTEHGFEAKEAVEINVALASFTLGFSLVTAYRTDEAADADDRVERVQALHDHPSLQKAAHEYVNWQQNVIFDFVLDRLLHAYSTPTRGH